MSEFHDYAERPTAPHDLRADADLIARLKRSSVGASDDEAVELVAQLDPDVIRAESDALLSERLAEFRANDGEVFTPDDHTIAEVLDHVDGDVNRAREALAAEQTGKDRSTLVAKLNELIDTQQENTEPVVVTVQHAEAGAAQNSTPEGEPTDVEVTAPDV